MMIFNRIVSMQIWSIFILITLPLVYGQDIITTIAGTGTSSFSGDGGVASSATLANPYGVTVDTSGRNTSLWHGNPLVLTNTSLFNVLIQFNSL